MSKIAVVYWSGTGNTAAMADLVAVGAKEKGATVDLLESSAFDSGKLAGYDAVAFGCPSMGAEQLEESEFEPMFTALEGRLTGKKLALFGSYGWGDGQWMRDWQQRCNDAGAALVADGLAVCGSPAGKDAESCTDLGRALA
ncbi:MAG: flavodoxin [Clostridia bacterium]|nr:flavodoxin [Clostridia bacterium]